MTSRIFYKTTYTVEILSETPIPEDCYLRDALEEAETGAYSGDVKSQQTVPVDGETMAKLLLQQRSSPSIFRLDIAGEDDEEELADLYGQYESASGNTVDENDNILDESGVLVGKYSPEMARLYLEACAFGDES
jgi:hypothetical protein